MIKEPTDGKIEEFQGEYRFLSNFWPASIEVEGIQYPTVEHAYQAQKTLDREERLKIAGLEKPGKSKRYARKLTRRGDWDTIRVQVMRMCLRKKFAIPQLRDMLLKTGNKILMEGNRWGDTFWGVYKGEGLNILGKTLMMIREELKEQKKE